MKTRVPPPAPYSRLWAGETISSPDPPHDPDGDRLEVEVVGVGVLDNPVEAWRGA